MAETIPERHQEFCKAVARLCRDHGMERVGLSYGPPPGDGWKGSISMTWQRGRHGEDSDRVEISSQLTVHAVLGGDGR